MRSSQHRTTHRLLAPPCCIFSFLFLVRRHEPLALHCFRSIFPRAARLISQRVAASRRNAHGAVAVSPHPFLQLPLLFLFSLSSLSSFLGCVSLQKINDCQ